MSQPHDPLADPLTPDLRAKVERAFGTIPAEPGALTDLERAALAAGCRDLDVARRFGVSGNAVYDALLRGRAKIARGVR